MRQEVQDIISSYDNLCYIMENEMSDRKKYKKFIINIFYQLREGFEIKELRECPVHFRFKEDGYIYTLQLRHFLTNIIFWEPLIALDSVDHLDETFIIDPKKISAGYIKSYIDQKIIIPFRNKISNKKLNMIIHDLIFNLSRISTDFNPILGMSISIESFIDVANKNERFNEILHTKVDPSWQPNEIEEYLHNLMREEIEILKKEENDLKPMLNAGAGIKDKQLFEFSGNIGLKPNISGETIPIPINSNLVVGGLNTVSGYFIDSLGGRKSLIMNKSKMGESGAFARRVLLLVSDVHLRKDKKHCRSITPISIEVKTKKHMERLIGRMYKLPHERNYKVLTENDTNVIGKKILIKSPITCSSKKGICECCYGPINYHTNYGLGIGSFAG